MERTIELVIKTFQLDCSVSAFLKNRNKIRNKVDWKYVCKYFRLTEQFMTKFKNHLFWPYVCQYQVISEKFIVDNVDKVDWKLISKYQNLTNSFICKHLAYIHKDVLPYKSLYY
jgi:hypothetical protein